jgi:hypothetical protein
MTSVIECCLRLWTVASWIWRCFDNEDAVKTWDYKAMLVLKVALFWNNIEEALTGLLLYKLPNLHGAIQTKQTLDSPDSWGIYFSQEIKETAQISTLANGIEGQSKLSTTFRFKTDGYRPIEVSFDEIRKEIQANTSIKVRWNIL